jgi:hypothetical protein
MGDRPWLMGAPKALTVGGPLVFELTLPNERYATVHAGLSESKPSPIYKPMSL